MHPLESIRAYYLSCLEESFSKCRADADSCVLEMILEIPREEEPELIYRLHRVDVFLTIGGNNRVREVNATPKAIDESSSRLRGNAQIVGPVVWNSLEFRVTTPCIPEGPILDWARYWLDVDDVRYEDARLFQEVVHRVHRPICSENGYNLTVDFGSASTRAFEELLTVLAADAENIDIGSFQFVHQF